MSEELRVCKKCGQTRSIFEFPLVRAGQVYRRHVCVECQKIRQKEWDRRAHLKRRDDPEKYQKRLAEQRVRYRENYQERYKAAKLEYNKTRRPGKLNAAHAAVKRAVDSGRLIRPNVCFQCNKETFVEAHHDDYSRPLDVRWLCRSCHSKIHRFYK